MSLKNDIFLTNSAKNVFNGIAKADKIRYNEV